MSPFHRLPCVLLFGASLSPAQTPPPAASAPPGHSHAHGQANAHGTVTLDQFVTSAAPFARNQVDLAQSTTVLSGTALQLKQQPSLGETLAGEIGMSATSFGPGASRPIIRGLGGDRVRLLENSVGTIDASVISPDHAVSVEPLLIERIEVVRGPASLLYGSNALGGVVNVFTHRIETDLPTEPVGGAFELRGSTAADEFSRGGVLNVAVQPGVDRAVVLHLDGFRRTAHDVRIPGFAESAALRAEETAHARENGAPAPDFARGRLPNSELDSQSGAVGVSFVSKSFHLGLSYSGVDSTYGVPGHGHDAAPGEAAGVRIDLKQRRTDVQGEWHGEAGFIHGARVKFGHGNYRHAEIEPGGDIGTVFKNKGYDARLELLHGDGKPWSGALGAHASRSDFAAAGAEAFLPASVTQSHALFAFEEVVRAPLTWQFGARIERTQITPAGGHRRRDHEVSGSLGAVWKLGAAHTLALSVTHTGRAPNTQELFAYGPHAGTQAFELGDARLTAERARGFEASLRRKTGFVTGAVTAYANRFSGYIFEQPTGLVAIEDDGAWEFLPPDHPDVAAAEGGLPVYRHVQRNARFWGAELETLWHLHDTKDAQLDLRLAADFTRAREGSRPLPRIPAARVIAGLSWTLHAWSAGVDCQFVRKQTRIAAHEPPSDSYALVSAHVSRTLVIGRARWDLFLRSTNLANEEARPHPSFVKELAPLPGRSFTAGVRLTF